MAGFYRPRHPERTVLYRVLFHHFDRFLTEYESLFEKEFGSLFQNRGRERAYARGYRGHTDIWRPD